MAELQGDLAVVLCGDEGHRAIEDDQALDEFLESPDLHMCVCHALRVGECAGTVAHGVLIERTDADTPVHHGHAALQRLAEPVLAAAAPGLHGENLGAALRCCEIERRVDPVDAFQHRYGMGGRRILSADVHERLEGFGQFDGVPSPFLYLAFYGVQMLCQSGGRRYGPEPFRIIGIGVE